jgi:phenylalanyl-tRNA synthetase alpha chain
MEEKLKQLEASAVASINNADSLKALDDLRVEFLGKKSEINNFSQGLKSLSNEEKPIIGKAINIAKQTIQDALNKQKDLLESKALKEKLSIEKIDVTQDGRLSFCGNIHPISRIMQRAIELLSLAGFRTHSGREIEDYYHNFTALNIPEHHPASSMHDTFYVDVGELLLRTQTSCGQIHVLENEKPPLRVISAGKVYRRDLDPTHTPMFHQLEGLVIEHDCTFAELKALLHEFLNRLFAKELKIRFRPSYFPFTEPSAEVDIQCHICDGAGCRLCGKTGWIEVLGCGMVHPQVLANVGIDSEEYSGYAFGLGLDRLAMLCYGIDDLRLMFENDVRFLEQF